jgi:hypothetical protein
LENQTLGENEENVTWLARPITKIAHHMLMLFAMKWSIECLWPLPVRKAYFRTCNAYTYILKIKSQKVRKIKIKDSNLKFLFLH